MRFKNKCVVVLGGNSGIGLASAIAFAREGARLVITGRNATTLEEARRQIGTDSCIAIQSDISDISALDTLFVQIKAQLGRINVLFVNAGVGEFAPLETISEEFWEHMMGINLKGPFFAVQKAVDQMAAGSSIIMTSSIGHAKGIPGNSVYAASKAGIRALVRNLGAELVGRGIRVNCFSPGPIDTPLFARSGVKEEEVAGFKDMVRQKVPMQRLGTVEEAANSVLFLASDESSFITGIDLFVDGGCVSF